MNWFQKLTYRVAAIDENNLNDSTGSDKVWASQIGFALMLTFIVLFGITFYSMTIIDGAEVLYDAKANSFEFDTNALNASKYIIYGVISIIIALVVVLFDRAFYQSDWFMHMPYKTSVSLKEKIGYTIKYFLKISVRIIISIFLAYTFSSFLELKFYESELLSHMQKKHLKENAKQYEKIKNYSGNLEKTVKKLELKKEKLLQKLKTIKYGGVVYNDDKFIKEKKQEISKLESKTEEKINKLKKEAKEDINKIKNENLNPLQKKLSKINKEIEDLNIKLNAEVYGIKKVKVENREITTTGKRGFGRYARLIKTQLDQKQKEANSTTNEINKYNKKIAKIEDNLKIKIEQLENNLNNNIKNIKTVMARYQENNKEALKADQETIKNSLKKELQFVNNKLEYYNKNRDKLIKEEQQKIIKSPEFIQFRDGPMSRLIAMEKLKKDPVLGKEISHFSIIVKGFLIFLEIAPVFAKMLFGPPTLYATKLQKELELRTQEVLKTDNADFRAIERKIELEKKKRELLKEEEKTELAKASRSFQKRITKRFFNKDSTKDVA